MRTTRAAVRTLHPGISAACLILFVLAGCATDAWDASDPYGRVLGQIYAKCGDMMVGRKSIRTLMPSAYNIDPYFEDATSRVFSGRMTRAGYVSALNGFYGADPESPGVRCILEQIPPAAKN
jgi:hypothetical protein